MCKATSELKLCTCSLGDDFPCDYWVLYASKYTKKDKIIREINRELYEKSAMGEIEFIVEDVKEIDFVKKETLGTFLRASLNQKNCFDVHFNIQEGDILELGMEAGTDKFHYYFEFEDNKWNECEFDIFEYDKVSEGFPKPDYYTFFKTTIV